MASRTSFTTLRRGQLDRLLTRPLDLRRLAVPKIGWVREIRQALGMTEAQLARRLQVTQASVASLEKAEAQGGITLNRLQKVAEALDCRLVYALVPMSSLQEAVTRQSEQTARRLVERTSHHMALEDQKVRTAEEQEQIAELAAELARTMRELWDGEAETAGRRAGDGL